MIRPELNEAKKYAADGYRMVPVCCEMLSDVITPINLLRKLKAANEHCYILESVENQEVWGRYTFLGYNPKLDVTCMNGHIQLKDIDGNVIKEADGIHQRDTQGLQESEDRRTSNIYRRFCRLLLI